MGGEVGDVAANIGVEPVLRLRVKPLLNILQRRHRGRNEIALGDERRGELAAVLIQPVAADHRDIAASDVARPRPPEDRKSAVVGKSVSGRVDLGGRRISKKKTTNKKLKKESQ